METFISEDRHYGEIQMESTVLWRHVYFSFLQDAFYQGATPMEKAG